MTGPASNSMVNLNREIVAPLQEFDSLARQVSEDMVNDLAPSMQTWASEATQSINAAQNAMQNFQMVASGAFMATADAMTAAGIAASVYGENVGKAMEQAAKAALASIAEQAGVNALNALAQGLWFLAQAIFFGDPDAAAAATTDFEAAAEWGAIAGVAGAAAAAVPGGKELKLQSRSSQPIRGGRLWQHSANRQLRPCSRCGRGVESPQRQPDRHGSRRGASRPMARFHTEHGSAAWRVAERHDGAEVTVCGRLVISSQWSVLSKNRRLRAEEAL